MSAAISVPPLPLGSGSGTSWRATDLLCCPFTSADGSQRCMCSIAHVHRFVWGWMLWLPLLSTRVGNLAWGSPVLRCISRLTWRKADYKGDFKRRVVIERPAPFPLTLFSRSQPMPAQRKVSLRLWVPGVQRPVYPSVFVKGASPCRDLNL